MGRVFKVLLILLFLPIFNVAAADFVYQAESGNGGAVQNGQWYLDKIKAKEAWDILKLKKKVTVAVLDTGIDMNHPDIQKNIWVNMDELDGDGIDNDGNGYIDDINGWDFLSSVPSPAPKMDVGYSDYAVKHGTFVSGIIAALHNGQYVDGVAMDVRIMPLRVLSAYGYGDSYPVAEAINYAVDNGADVINMSFGGIYHSQALKSAILHAYEAGAVIVAAAGNTAEGGTDIGENNVYPVCYDKELGKNMVIGVSAVDDKDVKAVFSNFGADCVDISAPGVNIAGLSYQDDSIADFKNYTIEDWQGTSFATAIVSGAAALLKASHPGWTNVKIYEALMSSSENIDGINFLYVKKMGAGRLNMAKAAEIAGAADFDSIKLFFADAVGGGGKIFGFGSDGASIDEFEIFADADVDGLNFDIVDVNGDGALDFVTGAVAGDFPMVRGVEASGKMLFGFAAYPESFKVGINFAAGDIDGDGETEIVTAPAGAAKPEIKIFNTDGTLQKNFVLSGLKNVGLSVDLGDVDNDGAEEIVVGTGSGVAPEIRIYNRNGGLERTIKPFVSTFRGGVNVLARDINGDKIPEILVGAGIGGGPQVQVYTGAGKRLLNFFAFDKNNKTGVRVYAGDIDNDGAVEIIAVSQMSFDGAVRIFDSSGVFEEELILDKIFKGGVNFVAM